jgi:A/G-specific adenine glycosylase
VILNKTKIVEFQRFIFSWWENNRRDLPWRHTRDPYNIAVSEVMLQQTQVLRVLPKYAEFIEAWPNVQSLAKASVGTVLRVWKGMGYNRRALYLHKMAKIVVETYGGIFPEDEKLLTKLTGLGKYTARAILVFAFGESVACVDTNIRQIITHFFYKDKEQRPEVIQSVADQLVPKGKAWEWHQALMDYGAANGKELRVRNKELRKKHIPFQQSDRFIRGKIIDYLRTRSYKRLDLTKTISDVCQKPVERIRNIIENLKSEGLVEINKDIISLPE